MYKQLKVNNQVMRQNYCFTTAIIAAVHSLTLGLELESQDFYTSCGIDPTTAMILQMTEPWVESQVPSDIYESIEHLHPPVEQRCCTSQVKVLWFDDDWEDKYEAWYEGEI